MGYGRSPGKGSAAMHRIRCAMARCGENGDGTEGIVPGPVNKAEHIRILPDELALTLGSLSPPLSSPVTSGVSLTHDKSRPRGNSPVKWDPSWVSTSLMFPSRPPGLRRPR